MRLVRSMEPPCADDDVQAIVASAEGWPAGLQLLARAMRDDGSGSADATTGREHSVFDYFEEEVLATLPDEVVLFLERSSVLDVLTGPVARRAARDRGQRHDPEVPRRISAASSSSAARRRPPAATATTASSPRCSPTASRWPIPPPSARLHQRCSAAMEARGETDGAVRHAIAAHDFERAADLVLVHAVELIFSRSGRPARPLDRACSATTPSTARPQPRSPRPGMGSPQATHPSSAGRPQRPLHSDHDGPLADGSPSATVALTMVRAMAGLEGVPGVIRDTTFVRAAGDAGSNSWWPMATLVLGTAHSMLGDDDRLGVSSKRASPRSATRRHSKHAVSPTSPSSTFAAETSPTPSVRPTGAWPSPHATSSAASC